MSIFSKIPADKVAHLKGGAKAAALGGLVGLVVGAGLGWAVDLPSPLACVLVLVYVGVGGLIAAVSAGVTKEFADAADNEIYPGMHSVEWQDAVATAAPGVLLFCICAVLATLVYRGQLVLGA